VIFGSSRYLKDATQNDLEQKRMINSRTLHCYKLCGYNIVLDIAGGSIHCVDDVAYDVIRIYELINDGKDQQILINRVLSYHPDITAEEVREVLADVEALKNRGKLFSPDTFTDVANTTNSAPLKALCMNVSHACNMSCTYCFAGHGSLGIIEPDTSLARQNGIVVDNKSKLMSLETGKKAVDFLVRNSGERRNLDIDFFGGEPLLNWEVVKDIVRYAREIERGCGKNFRFTLTTNGLLIDDDVIDFTNNQMHNVVLSLDGRPEIHNAMRKLPNGDGSYENVVDKIKKLVEERRGKGYYIRGTFTRENKDFVNDILHIADLGFKEISLEPVVKQGDRFSASCREAENLSPCFTFEDLPELCAQYETLAVEMLRREKLGTGFNFYHFNLDLTGGPCIYKRIAGCGVGTEYLAVTPTGELYPCHQFIGDQKFLMGDVWRGITNAGLRAQFINCNIYSRSECKDCWARFYCSGGCAANAYHDMGNIEGIYDVGCELFKKRIECAIMMHVAKAM